MADCGLFDSEVFVDENGVYVGDFSYTDGPGGPFGWVHCMGFCEDPAFFFGVFDYFAPPTPCNCRELVAIPVGFSFGCGPIYTVADASGPLGLEAMAAMEVNLPGSPDSRIGWAGPQVVDADGNWVYGVLGGSTGWKPLADETWVFQCWAKIVPDENGVEIADANLRFEVAPEGFGNTPVNGDELALTTDWQFFQTTFAGGFFPDTAWYWPLIGFTGAIEHQISYTGHFFNTPVPLHGYAPYGRVHIKCAHLYKLHGGKGNWIDSFHGHG